MMRLSQIAAALDAELIGADVMFNSVNTDSRKIGAGDLFIALHGEKFDGAEYVASALKMGALAAVVNQHSYAALRADLPENAALLLVADTRIALGKLAAWWRAQFAIPLVAITGSNGKTTVKEMLAAILREHAGDSVLATQGNFNNDIGMPLTLLKLNAQHRYAVIEMGMNHLGEIDYLTRLAQPDVALVNNAAGAHLQGLGSIENVARAKGEIFAGLKNNGVAIINADDAHAQVWRDLAAQHRCVEFSLEHAASVQGQWAAQGFGGVLHALTPVGDLHVLLQVPGAHNARNALAAASAALALEIPLPTITTALQNFGGVAGRLQRKAGCAGATLIDDTYNANPASMRAALEVLAKADGQRVFVLGDMGELGADAAQFHRDIGRSARELGIAKLFALGELSKGAAAEFGAGAQHFVTLENLCAALTPELDSNTTVLIKGSRFMQMERVVKQLQAAPSGTLLEQGHH